MATVLGSVFGPPATLLLVVVAATAYAAGAYRSRRRAGRPFVRPAHAVAFGAGLAVVAVALVSPLDAGADTNLTAHMVQHVLLLCVAGPLLALGRPLRAVTWSVPRRFRARASGATRSLSRSLYRHVVPWVGGGCVLQAVVMLVWHIPVAYDTAVRIPVVHACEHASFLLVSFFAWWTVVSTPRRVRGATAIAALFGSVPGMALGAAMVLSPRPWYGVYASAPHALTDQQVAGVVMWGFGGIAAVVAAAALFASWLSSPAQVDLASGLLTFSGVR